MSSSQMVARDEVDWTMDFAPAVIEELDGGAPLTMVAGMHVGCFELFAHDHIRSIADLKGRKVGVPPGFGTPRHLVEHHGELRRHRSRRGYPLGQRSIGQANGSFHRPEDRCFLGLAAAAAGTPRARHRPFAGEQFNRPSLVAILLLHADEPYGIRPQIPCGDQARSCVPC